MATTTTPRTTPTSRPRAPRKSNGPIIVGIAIAVVLVLALVFGIHLFSSDKKHTPAVGTTGAVTSANALLGKALTEMNGGDLAQAKTDLQQVSQLDPKNKYAFYNLGYIAQTQGNKSDAESQYKLALAIDPKYDPALYNLAIIRTADGDTAGAITLYEQAVASAPTDADAHFNLGLLLRQTGHVAAGTTQIQDAVQLAPALASAAQAQGVPVR